MPRASPSVLSETGAQRGRPHLPAACQEILEHLLAIRQHHEPPDDVLKLAHVAAPGILQESGRRLGRQLLVSPVLLVELFEEARGKGEDLLLTLSQRGNANLDNIQTIVEILAELTSNERQLEVSIRCRDDADVDIDHPVAADAGETEVLKDM